MRRFARLREPRLLTGQYAARSGINSFLENTTSNLARDNANSLSLTAPSMVRAFHDAGYATGHFGKWHMGGGRDVGYAVGTTAGTNAVAPRIVEYGYDQAWTQMEGSAIESSMSSTTAAMRTAPPRGPAPITTV